MKTDPHIKLFLCGDVFIQRRMPEALTPSLEILSALIKEHDFRFGNLETTIHQRECWPAAFPGGSYAMAVPLCLKDLKKFGFNIFNTANNHSMDYDCGGVFSTLRYLDKEDLLHAGTGKNLADASAPVFLECSSGRVALVGITSSFHDSYLAGPQNQDMIGRPGVSPLRHEAIYELDEKNFDDLTRIAEVTGINNYHNRARKTGYLPQSDLFKFGSFNFKKGEKNHLYTQPLNCDMQRTEAIINDAKSQVDIVVVSVHSHQFKANDVFIDPDFIAEFAHKCVDAGAKIVACHGPHVMRGVEIYNKGIIFHGLGNFILQHESMSSLPEEQYLRYGMTRQTSSGVGEFFEKRTKGQTIGLAADPYSWKSIVASLDWSPSSLLIKLYPIEISKGRNGGYPYLSDRDGILEDVRQMSAIYHTEVMINKEKHFASIAVDL